MFKNFFQPPAPPVPSKKAKITVEDGGVIITTPDGNRVFLHPSAVRAMTKHLPDAAFIAEITSKKIDQGPQAWKSGLTQ